ncbi:ScyD/ScyE family protein [Streptomyces rochei]|nr:ScyD/ScyE family protein [Streptomyces rochei]WMI61833.1 ScyD/ScyE family protein [Streptomyces rochei]
MADCPVDQTCVGTTGSVYKVKGSFQGRVATGLASTAKGVAPGAPISANGPSDVVPDRFGGYVVVSGLGGTTESRAALGEGARTLGTVFRTRDGKVLADLTDHETRLNPDGGDVHANPWRLARSGSGYLATDAGANTVVRGNGDGTTATEYLLPKNELPTGAAETVPTGIAKAADGTVYVADMSGGRVGASRVWKIAPGQQPEILATGMTNLIDLDLDRDGDLIALSYSAAALVPAAAGRPVRDRRRQRRGHRDPHRRPAQAAHRRRRRPLRQGVRHQQHARHQRPAGPRQPLTPRRGCAAHTPARPRRSRTPATGGASLCPAPDARGRWESARRPLDSRRRATPPRSPARHPGRASTCRTTHSTLREAAP